MIKFISKFVPNFIKKSIVNYLDKNYLFVGWNLKTKTCPPWKNTISENTILQSNYFNDLNEELIEKIKKGKFLLSQKKSEKDHINQLKWRHYNILLSLKYLKQLKKENINLVEAGVADGLTAWFAMSFLEKEKINYNQFILIDSWEKMKFSFLKQSESKQVGRHKENDIEVTKKNLDIFGKTKFLKGFIPEVLEKYKENEAMIDWLHVDLNSSVATKELLEFFSNKLNKNAIIIFDDYGWPNHEESRIEIDKWSMKKSGILWPLPTGQALFFNI